MTAKLTMGPLLFHWPAEQKRDFYFRIADEADIDRVYMGEVVCSKRAPFFDEYIPEVISRLKQAGKEVVISSLAELMIKRERNLVADLCRDEGCLVEANDATALYHLRGKPHYIGQLFNTYNEDSLVYLAENGATHFTLPPELPGKSLSLMAEAAKNGGVSLEVQIYGRIPLALSARCYHARSHNRTKDNCQFVCENDPDGMVLETISGQPFLAINGIQTLSYKCLNLIGEMKEMQDMGINIFRLSPHSHDMVETASLIRSVLKDKMSVEDANEKLQQIGLQVPFANGFFHKKEGYHWVAPN